MLERAGATGEAGSSTSFGTLGGDLLGKFNGVTISSIEFLFSDRTGGETPAAAFAFVEAAGTGLTSRRFGDFLSSERGGISRPPGLCVIAGNSISVRGGGRVEFCVWMGV